MRSLYESISTISTELNTISTEGIPSAIKDLKYSGDNANFAISLFQEYFISAAIFEALKLLSNYGLEKYIQ